MPTEISWTDETWNPLRGCTRVSPGCQHCYAERMSARGLPGHKSPTTGEPFAVMTPSGARWTGKVELIKSRLMEPLKWKKPRKIFVNSMSDLFHESVPDEWIVSIFQVMEKCPAHTFQILTKRGQRMFEFLSRRRWRNLGHSPAMGGDHHVAVIPGEHRPDDAAFLPNVWLGVSVEDQQRADERIPWLLRTPAAVRFVSAEPLLGLLEISRYLQPYWSPHSGADRPPWLDQVIVGGESGPGARPMRPDWVRSIRDQCIVAGVPFHFKQWGEYCDWDNLPDETYRRLDANGVQPCEGMIRVGKKWTGALLDGREWREFPRAAGAEVEE